MSKQCNDKIIEKVHELLKDDPGFLNTVDRLIKVTKADAKDKELRDMLMRMLVYKFIESGKIDDILLSLLDSRV